MHRAVIQKHSLWSTVFWLWLQCRVYLCHDAILASIFSKHSCSKTIKIQKIHADSEVQAGTHKASKSSCLWINTYTRTHVDTDTNRHTQDWSLNLLGAERKKLVLVGTKSLVDLHTLTHSRNSWLGDQFAFSVHASENILTLRSSKIQSLCSNSIVTGLLLPWIKI